MFKFIEELIKLRKLRKVRSQIKEIEENKLPPKFPVSLLENPYNFTVHRDDYGDDITNYINNVIHGIESPIRDISSPKYTYKERVNISINFWITMEKWCEKNKEFCKTTLVDNTTLEMLKEDEDKLLRDLKL